MSERGSHRVVRPALVADAEAIATINVLAWQTAYRGLLPDSYLDRLTIPDRVPDWGRRIASPGEGTRILVLEDPAAAIVSYCIAGPYRHSTIATGPELPALAGEIFAVYAHPDHWDTGAGRTVFQLGVEHLRESGFVCAVLWMLEGNARAARFYERHGWQPDGARLTEPLGEDGNLLATEVRYRFDFW